MISLVRLVAAALGLAVCLSAASVALAQPPARVVIQQVDASAYPKVSAILDVSDAAGLPVSGVNAGELQVQEQGNAVSGATLTPFVEAGLNLAVALVIDVSGSMAGQPLERAKAAAVEFVNRLAPEDQVTVLSFGSQVRQVQAFTIDRELLRRSISGLVAVGNTKLYDALYIGVEEVSKSSLRRKVVVLLSDGDDTQSARRLEEGVQLASAQGVVVFTIGVGAAPSNILQSMADQTGGSNLTSPSPGELGQAYQAVSNRLRSAYVLAYSAPRYRAAPERKLELTVNHAGGAASGEAVFTVNLPPLQVEIRQDALAEGTQTLVTVEIGPDVALASEVTYAIDSQPPRVLSGPPYRFSLSAGLSGVTGGQQTMRVTVTDILNRSVQKEGRFQVGVPPPPPSKAAPAWLAAIDYLRQSPITIVGLVVGHVVGLRRGIRCPACGRRHRRQLDCAVCGPRVRGYVKPLGEMLLRGGLISQKQLDDAVALGRDQGRRLGEVLTGSQLIEKPILQQALQVQARSTSYALRYQRLSFEQDEELPLRTGVILYGGITIVGLLVLILPFVPRLIQG